MKTSLVTVLLILFMVLGCGDDSTVNQPQPAGPDVLLSDDFDSLTTDVWQLLDTCNGLSQTDGQGNLRLMCCEYPAYVTSGLSSDEQWEIESGYTYTATLRIGTPDCVGLGSALHWGLDCYDGETFVGSIGFNVMLIDVYSAYVQFGRPYDPCMAYSEQATNVCNEFHSYVLNISDTKIEAFIDETLQKQIDRTGCDEDFNSFKIGVTVSTLDSRNHLLIDKITLERSPKK